MADSIFALTPGNFLWPYFAGIAILLVGLFAARKELVLARGQEKLVVLAPLFFVAPIAVFATQHFTNTKFVSLIVPAWLPVRVFWTYFVGTCLLAAALSIAVKKHARLAGTLLAILLVMFVLFVHTPNIVAHPKNILTWAFAFRDLSFSGGALALAETQTKNRHRETKSTLVTVSRIFISVAAIFFGVAHFLHPEFLPAVDLDQNTPNWIPVHAFWAYLAGTVFIVAGASMLLNRKTRFAATRLAITVLILLLLVYLPIVIHKPTDIDNGLNYFVSTLAFSGAVLLLAGAVREKD